ncbi:hypothetical protein GCM10027280_41100 [Micromonospora polyrhachis]|uniref:Uncharacterized protein n=1 Tax=Micromonospora polyrhachis TaxID=1282883 RepID=A0A7W7WMT8_9ACTN|nr:hypothetical protein [Micromonospora polyrhachis]MBB4956809.1 hypothetical protein [Micromonospora polyrhachis]
MAAEPDVALTVAAESDVALTVALAEYEHLRDALRANTEQATARFNFFLVVASAATAVSGGLLTGGGSGTANTSAVIGLGALVLLLGLTVFVRQVEFTNRANLYGVAVDSVRTYLVRRAPSVGPYLILPTLDDPGVYQGRPPGGRWTRDVIGLAGTVSLVDSALVGLGAGIAARHVGAATWLAATSGVVVLSLVMLAHLWYISYRRAAATARIWTSMGRRHQSSGARDVDGVSPNGVGGASDVDGVSPNGAARSAGSGPATR